jgi:hypothetical protein
VMLSNSRLQGGLRESVIKIHSCIEQVLECMIHVWLVACPGCNDQSLPNLANEVLGLLTEDWRVRELEVNTHNPAMDGSCCCIWSAGQSIQAVLESTSAGRATELPVQLNSAQPKLWPDVLACPLSCTEVSSTLLHSQHSPPAAIPCCRPHPAFSHLRYVSWCPGASKGGPPVRNSYVSTPRDHLSALHTQQEISTRVETQAARQCNLPRCYP